MIFQFELQQQLETHSSALEVHNHQDVQNLLERRLDRPDGIWKFVQSKEFLEIIQTSVKITLGELFYYSLKYCKKYAIPLDGIERLLKLINSIFTIPILPQTTYFVDMICNKQCKVSYFKICPNCGMTLNVTCEDNTSVECNHCQKVVKVPKNQSENTFALIDPSDAIREVIELYHEHYDYVVKDRHHKKGIIKDIYDGKKYRNLVKSLPKNDKYQYVTLCFNTDGAEPFKSSNASAWPIYIIVNEVPINKRFKHVITVGIWFGKSQPKMQIYMHEFVNMMNKITEDGIPCTIKNEKRLLKPYVICGCVDTPARKKCNCKVNFNAYFGCDMCYAHGYYYKGNVRYVIEGEIKLRDEKTTKNLMKRAIEKSLSIRGINGISPLIFLENFDIDEGFPPDKLHAADSGTAKHITRFMMKKLSPHQRQLLDDYLLQIRAPTTIGNLTKKMSDRSKWKAKDWENYVFFYSIPVLESVGLRYDILKHWSLFVNSMHIVSNDTIEKQNLFKADSMIREFVLQVEKIYGKKAMVYNVHQLLHIIKSILNFGPFQVQSTYPFEAANNKTMKAIHSANGCQKQIIRQINVNYTLQILKKSIFPHEYILHKDFLDGNGRNDNAVQVENGVYFNFKSSSIIEIIQKFNLSSESTFHSKMFSREYTFTSSCIENPRSCNSYARLSSGQFVKLIHFICDSENEKNIFIYTVAETMPHELSDYIYLYLSDGSELMFCDVKEIVTQCVFMEVGELRFISPRPNSLNY